MPESIKQGDIVWADYGDPFGSEPGFRRPVLVVQSNQFNRSRIGTILCIPFSSRLQLANLPGNLLVRRGDSGLDTDSVLNVTQIGGLDRSRLGEWIGSLHPGELSKVFRGLDVVLGR